MAVNRIEIVRGTGNDHTWTVFFDRQNAVEIDSPSIMSLLSGVDRRDPVVVAAVASDVLQMLWDDQTGGLLALADLPDDEPAKTVDPARPDFFHARAAETVGQGQHAIDIYRPTVLVGGTATHLVSRSSLLTVLWDGTVGNLETESPPESFR